MLLQRTDFDVSKLSLVHEMCKGYLDIAVMEEMMKEQGYTVGHGSRMKTNPLSTQIQNLRRQVLAISRLTGLAIAPRKDVKNLKGSKAVDLTTDEDDDNAFE